MEKKELNTIDPRIHKLGVVTHCYSPDFNSIYKY